MLVPDSAVHPPPSAAEVILTLGAKTSDSVPSRCEKAAMASSLPVCSPGGEPGPGYTAPTEIAQGSEEGQATPWMGRCA